MKKLTNNFVEADFAPNKPSVVRRAIECLAEEKAVEAVFKARREPTLRGDLRDLMKKFTNQMR